MPFRRTPSLSYPDAEHVAHEEPLVHALAVGEIHEEVVERGADPGRDAGDDVDVGQVRNVDLPPGQHGGQRDEDGDDGQAVRHDVDRLVVQVEERVEAAPPIGRRAVVPQHVLVELQVRRDLGALDERRSRRPAAAPLASVGRRCRRRGRPVGGRFPSHAAVVHAERG